MCLLSTTLFFAIPAKKTDAFPVEDFVTEAKTTISSILEGSILENSVWERLHQSVLRPLAWALAKAVLANLTAQTVNWINSGFNGNPAYITNPDQFFTNIGDQVVTQQLSSSGLLSKICTPFQPQIRLALVQQYLYQNQLGQCSLGNIVNNYSNWVNNFSNGGWDTWFAVTQNAQNNPIGSYLQAQDQLTISLANQQQTYQQQVNWGQGFLSYQKCVAKPSMTITGYGGTGTQGGGLDYTVYNECLSSSDHAGDVQYCELNFPPTTITAPAAGPAQPGDEASFYDVPVNAGGACTQTETVTPGSIIKDQLGKSLGSTFDTLNLVNDINQVVGALMTELVKSVVGGGNGGGLRGVSQTQSGQTSSLAAQLNSNSPQGQSQLNSTVSNIYSGLPDSYQQYISSSSPDTLNPTIDQNAIQNEIDQQIAAAQGQTNSNTSSAPAISYVEAFDPKNNAFATTDEIGYVGYNLVIVGSNFAATTTAASSSTAYLVDFYALDASTSAPLPTPFAELTPLFENTSQIDVYLNPSLSPYAAFATTTGNPNVEIAVIKSDKTGPVLTRMIQLLNEPFDSVKAPSSQ